MPVGPGTTLLHYRITGKIGEGGMGAVYRATDSKLNREVALKVLPADMASDPDRLRRFQREARAVAALNHPHIVTIFSVEQDGVTHFLTMELVDGKSLDRLLPPGGLPLAQVFDIGIALADALATAHEKGIVHRDLKPGNVMLSNDGRIKVLDFGLAKLGGEGKTSPLVGDPDATSAETAAAPLAVSLTQAGAVMGTAPYMSPEQLEGKPVDHRTDIFALGVLLYEIATGNRPFRGETSAALISSIMRDAPRPVTDLRQDVPRHLARIIDHCLQKSVLERFQSTLDIRNELRTLRTEVDSGAPRSSDGGVSGNVPTMAMPSADGGIAAGPSSAGASAVQSATGISSPGSVVPSAGPAPRAGSRAVLLVSVLGLAGLAFGLYSFLTRPDPAPVAAPGVQDLNLSVLMSRNNLTTASLSGDGRYLAYVTGSGRTTSLTVRQVKTGSDIPIVTDSEVPVRGIRFSPDTDYLYFLNQDPDLPNYSALFQVPSLGGTPRKVFFDVDTAPTFSPDGTQVCFRRGLISSNADSLVIGNLATGEERQFTRIENPLRYEGAPAWSPDGTRIAMAVGSPAGGVKGWAVTIDVESGESQPVGDKTWLNSNSLGWTRDGKALMVSAFEFGVGLAPQVLRLPFPDGPAVRMTNDLDGYTDISLSTDGTSLAALRRSTVNNLWVAPKDGETAPVTFASGSAASLGDIVPLPGGAVAFSAPRDNKVFIWRMNGDGTERRQLTSQGLFAFSINHAPGVGLVFTRIDGGERILGHVWRMDPDGEGLEQLTDGSGEQLIALSPAGNAVMFTRWEDPQAIWILKLDGSEPYELARGSLDGASFSPDGQQVLVSKLEGEQGSFFPRRYIIPVDGGEPLATFLLPPGTSSIRWTPDGKALTYVDRRLGWNLMRKQLPDGEAEPLTNYREGQVVDHNWHSDGSRLVLHRRVDQKNSLWELESGATEPTRVTEFKTGRLSRPLWAPDEPLLYFGYSTSSQDVVLISGFE